MSGYGDPNNEGTGYGDPTTTDAIDVGYGDPTQSLTIKPSGDYVHHLGGAPLYFNGLIPIDLGPFRVKALINNEQIFLYSGQAGDSYDIHPSRDELLCFSPPAPAGSYDLVILYGDHFTNEVTIQNGLRIKPALRNTYGYAVKTLYPKYYKTGPKNTQLQKIDLATTQPEQRGPLELIIDAFANQIQILSGHLETCTIQRTEAGDSLVLIESSLGFKNSGYVFIGTKKYAYTLENDNLRLENALIEPIEKKVVVRYVND